MSIGTNIKIFRKNNGYTQRELAERVGVSTQAISKWETDSGAPDISLIVPLAVALNVSTDDLFGYHNDVVEDEFERVRRALVHEEVFRNSKHSTENYSYLAPYFAEHTRDSRAASQCLKCLADIIVSGEASRRTKDDLIAECERYSTCVEKFSTDADELFRSRFIMSRVYSALGDREKANRILDKIPVTFGDRLYWEAEVAQANGEYEKALDLCKKSFAAKARYISRCIRMAGEIAEKSDKKNGVQIRIEREEYMLRLLNAFLSGGEYLPCRQIFQKHILLVGMCSKYLRLGYTERAIDLAEMLFDGYKEYYAFVRGPGDARSLMFCDNDRQEDKESLLNEIGRYVEKTIERLKKVSDERYTHRIKALLEKYGYSEGENV